MFTQLKKGYVNFCGTVNLKTGHNKYFNPLEDNWGKGCYACLFRKKPDWGSSIDDKPRFLLVCGWGSSHKVSDEIEIVHSQTHRTYDYWQCVRVEPVTKAGFANMAGFLGRSSVSFGTWD